MTTRARLTLDDLETVAELADTVRDLKRLLEQSLPLVAPLGEPLPAQLTARTFAECEPRTYPALLKRVLGPPLQVAPNSLLGFVVAEAALAAMRQGETQAALAALFLSTLCASRLEDAAQEALHHLLLESDAQSSVGLLEVGAWRTGASPEDVTHLRQRLGLRFATTAAQIRGTFGAPPGA